jgi:AcrR family transcriptional regulator
MAERSKALDWKSSNIFTGVRGFESHSVRHNSVPTSQRSASDMRQAPFAIVSRSVSDGIVSFPAGFSTNGRATFPAMVVNTSTEKGSATRELILARSYELAQEGGVEGLSIGTVAIAAGMSKSGVFAHFGSKEQLQLALLESVGARFVEFVQAPALREPRGLPRLRKLTERWCEWSRAHRSGCVLLSAAVEYDGRREGAIRDHVLRQQAGWRDEVRRTIQLAVDVGHFSSDTDTAQLAFEIYSLMLGLHHDAGLFGYDEARHLTERALERLFASYRPNAAEAHQ